MITSTFNPDTGILITNFSGEVTLKQVIGYIEETKKKKTFPRKLKICTNATDAHFTFSTTDIDAIVQANNKSLEQYETIIDAIIVSHPQTTAISMLYKEFAKNKKYKFEVFSTHKMANEWLANL